MDHKIMQQSYMMRGQHYLISMDLKYTFQVIDTKKALAEGKVTPST